MSFTRPRSAVVLAAGQGLRLGKLGRQIPKGSIRLGAAPIIDESISKLGAIGIEHVVVVVGHLAPFFESLLSFERPTVEIVSNSDFENSGTLRSLICGVRLLDEDVLVLESDLVYEIRALEAVVDSKFKNAVVVSDITGNGDEVYVWSSKGCLRFISKSLGARLAEPTGEYIGIAKLSREFLARLRVFHRRALPMAEYDLDGFAVLSREEAIHCCHVSNLCWAEIDNIEDLHRARLVVYPDVATRDEEYGIEHTR